MARRTGAVARPLPALLALCAFLGVGLAAPAAALDPSMSALDPSVSALAPPGAALADSDGTFVTYRAAPGQRNDVQVTLTYEDAGFSIFHWRIDDVVPITAVGTCEHPVAGDRTVVVCDGFEGTGEGPFLEIWLSDLDDRIVTGGGGTVHGGIGNDSLISTGSRAVLFGAGGDDLVQGGPGNDVLAGDSGADLLFGAQGQDVMTGGTGDDVLWGNSNNDQLFGNSGDDDLHGGPGTDRLSGGPGRDLIDQD